MSSIDSYREKTFFGYRLIDLFDNHVIVSGYRAFGFDFTLNIPLYTLEPSISYLGIREQTRLIGLIVFTGGTIGALAWVVIHRFTNTLDFGSAASSRL